MEKENGNSWLEGLYKGEEKAYETLFDEYFFALTSFAVKYLKDREAAEDIVQDILYELWLNKKHFATIISLKVYLYQSVCNRCLNVLKHLKVESRYFTELHWKEKSEFF